MRDNSQRRLVETWQLTKPAVSGQHGLVASQHYDASAAGAEVLADGGNALDAAVAASLVVGTVEPWMSGLGGGGFMLFYEAATDTTHSIEFGMRAPRKAKAEDYPLVDGEDSDLFGWPAVLEDRNVNGPLSMATPGYLAGISAALERFGSKPFSELVTPAIDSAQNGMSVDWYATLKIASGAKVLSQYPESARTYLPDGLPPAGEWGGPMPQITLGNLAGTLEALQQSGATDFYHGDVARQIIEDANACGSSLSADDLSGYQPLFATADHHQYRNATVFAAPGMSAGPTLRDTLTRLESRWQAGATPDATAYSAYADSLYEAYAHRLETLGDVDDNQAPACTTHLTSVDRDGNMVALTQTLLSVFGSKVMLPQSGILMNNGMMWFDPRSGRPNSMAPGKRPLSNMCPTLFKTATGERYALGASGGRRIMPAVMQLISMVVDYGMDVDTAMHQPRIDVSGAPMVSVDEKLGDAVAEALAQKHNVLLTPNAVYPAMFACPNLICDGGSGPQTGAAFIASPWSAVAAAEK